MCGAVTKGASGMCPREIGQRPRRAGPTAAGEPGPGARPGEALPSACSLLTPLFQSGFTAVGTEGNQPSLSPSGQSPASVSEDLREKVGEANRSLRPCAWSGSRDWPCWLGGLTPTGCLIRPGSLQLPVWHQSTKSRPREPWAEPPARCAAGPLLLPVGRPASLQQPPHGLWHTDLRAECPCAGVPATNAGARTSNLVAAEVTVTGNINSMIWSLGDDMKGQSYFCPFGSQAHIF